jgi:hypothetical protein
MTTIPRPCERQCRECQEWKHHSHFKVKGVGRTSTARFDPVCKSCRNRLQDLRKNTDRALWIITQRARRAARKAGETTEFFMVQMNYRALVPWLRAMMGEEGLCLACGMAFRNERDVQIEHCEPPQHRQDWERLHARNIRLLCGTCNKTKHSKVFAEWLAEQESARRSHFAALAPEQEQQLAFAYT